MENRLKSKKGEVFIIFAVVMVAAACGMSALKANQKNKTVDTIENPATPRVAYNVNNFK